MRKLVIEMSMSLDGFASGIFTDELSINVS